MGQISAGSKILGILGPPGAHGRMVYLFRNSVCSRRIGQTQEATTSGQWIVARFRGPSYGGVSAFPAARGIRANRRCLGAEFREYLPLLTASRNDYQLIELANHPHDGGSISVEQHACRRRPAGKHDNRYHPGSRGGQLRSVAPQDERTRGRYSQSRAQGSPSAR
jgi:hypothetical protein